MLAQFAQARRVRRFRQLVSRRILDEPVMPIYRLLDTEQVLQQDVHAGRPEQVSAPHHVGDALQGALVDLVDLALVAKQVHWNVVGPRFRSVHLQLDEVVTSARTHSDVVAERASALGVTPDGRAATVASARAIPPEITQARRLR